MPGQAEAHCVLAKILYYVILNKLISLSCWYMRGYVKRTWTRTRENILLVVLRSWLDPPSLF
jgi:hypothetical protein